MIGTLNAIFFVCFLHAFALAFILFIYFRTLNYFRKVKNNEEWTLLKEYFNIGVLLVFIGITDFLMRDLLYINFNNWSWNYLFED